MKEAARKQRNDARLLELHPIFRLRIQKVIAVLESVGVRPRIQDAWRSSADQKKAYRRGNSKLLFGFHNVTAPDGTPSALAVDILDDDSPLSPSKGYLLQLAAAAEVMRLVTGIRWGVPKRLIGAINAAIYSQDFDVTNFKSENYLKHGIKIGWDPTHVQLAGITVAQAKAGIGPGPYLVSWSAEQIAQVERDSAMIASKMKPLPVAT